MTSRRTRDVRRTCPRSIDRAVVVKKWRTGELGNGFRASPERFACLVQLPWRRGAPNENESRPDALCRRVKCYRARQRRRNEALVVRSRTKDNQKSARSLCADGHFRRFNREILARNKRRVRPVYAIDAPFQCRASAVAQNADKVPIRPFHSALKQSSESGRRKSSLMTECVAVESHRSTC